MIRSPVPAAACGRVVSIIASALLAVVLLVPAVARSEPYLAVRSGAKCMVTTSTPPAAANARTSAAPTARPRWPRRGLIWPRVKSFQ